MTTIHTVFQRLWRQWLALTLLVVMAGCATGPKMVPHAFSFDGNYDKWADKVDLLAYAYGDRYHMVREDLANPSSSLYAGKTSLPPSTGVNGPMPVGEFLHVKWRLKATGEVFEERVDLRDRLPTDMTDQELTFVIDERRLYVYVVTPLAQAPGGKTDTHRTWHSKYNVTYEIFPTLEKRGEK
ncbi:hypothetical protein [Hydrogenophaga luteola]|uniref:Uncharacterized protein n=1 Tax=Hydrogenophaga luteola TaxID=1591122 RepID=A0ABV7W4W9_9BURK